jgi:tol-pal system beta propeller repeat protein TolB
MRRLTPITIALFVAACQDAPPTSPAATTTLSPSLALANGSPVYCGSRCGGPILFDRYINNGTTHYIGKMNADGTNPVILHLGSTPAWSPGFTKIAFAYTGAVPGVEIWTMNADGSGAVQLTVGGGNFFPSWSPDGTKIVFVSNRTGSWQIWSMNANGANQTQLTNVPNNNFPSWSPDGTKILFTSNRTGNDDVFVMNTDGTNVQALTTDPGIDGAAVWSPDGKRIAYTNMKAGCDIVIMRADGTAKTPVVNGLDDCEAPSWSPNGSKLAFISPVGPSSYAIFTMNVDGSALKKITSGRNFDVLPAWSRK